MESLESLELEARAATEKWVTKARALRRVQREGWYVKACSGEEGFCSYLAQPRAIAAFGRLSKSRASQVIAAVDVVDNLYPEDPCPPSDHVLRPLVTLAPASQAAVWHRAVGIQRDTDAFVVSRTVVERLCQEYRTGTVVNRSDPYTSSDSFEWYSPPEVLTVVKALCPSNNIDLDICGSKESNKVVGATQVLTLHDDSIHPSTAWPSARFAYGNVPGGVRYDLGPTKDGSRSTAGLFLERAEKEVATGNLQNVLLHVRAAVGHVWFRNIYKYPHCWWREHIAFIHPHRDDTAQTIHGSCFVFIGEEWMQERFVRIFSRHGYVPGKTSWATPRVPKIIIRPVPCGNNCAMGAAAALHMLAATALQDRDDSELESE